MTSPFTLFRLWAANRLWHWRLSQTRRFLAGPRRWEALDRLEIPGFGTELLRVDFPPDLGHPANWRRVHDNLAPILDTTRAQQLGLLRAILLHAPDLGSWPLRPTDDNDSRPWLENPFLGLHDIVVLHGMLLHLQPRRYIEIGSGVSTRVAAAARNRGGNPFLICSFDPEPRATVEGLCDEIHRGRMEHMVDKIQELAQPGDVIFFDGSHRSFPGSDVTLFFLDLLPRLPVGVIVHIHDVYLPADYPPELTPRLWSEQYILAAWLLGGGRRLEILLPCACLLGCPEGSALFAHAIETAPPHQRLITGSGSSFWFKTT